jgi:hypothetical protein
MFCLGSSSMFRVGYCTFSCNVYNKSFGSKQAIKAHQKSLRHTSAVQRAEKERVRQTLVGATTSAGNVSSYPLVNQKSVNRSKFTFRLSRPRSYLIHLRHPQTRLYTTQMTAVPQTKKTGVTKAPDTELTLFYVLLLKHFQSK